VAVNLQTSNGLTLCSFSESQIQRIPKRMPDNVRAKCTTILTVGQYAWLLTFADRVESLPFQLLANEQGTR
jgi:hypothetical protein